MAGIGEAASVIAVVQLSAQVYSVCREYYLGVKSARKDIERLSNEVLALKDILESVDDLARNPTGTKLSTLAILRRKDGPTDQCEKELAALIEKLEPDSKERRPHSIDWRALKWPMKSKDVDKVIASLERHKATFNLALTADQTALNIAVDDSVIQLRTDFAAARLDDVRDNIITWLSTTDPSSNHVSQRRKHQPETGQWFVESPEFMEWQRTPGSLLWLHGTSGCGKTVLSSTIIEAVIDECRSKNQVAVAYYYFDFNNNEKQKVSNFLSSLIAQLCAQKTELPERARKLYHDCHEGYQKPTITFLAETLRNVLQEFTDAYIVVDALDECPERDEEREELLRIINRIQSWSLRNLHLLATSRQEFDIEEAMTPLLTSPAICIQNAQVDADIKTYVRDQLATDTKLKKWPADLKAEIEETLLTGANGMFRWAFCQLDTLKRCMKISMIRSKLKSLPRDLEQTYARILLGIAEEQQEDAVTALRWLTFSERPLKLEELVEALIIIPTNDPPFAPEDRLSDPHNILHILPGLVTISTSEDESVAEEIRLAHFSVKEYLISSALRAGPASGFATDRRTANQFITESCLLYILQYDQAMNRSSSIDDLRRFPLLEYACRYWYVHKRVFSSELQTPTARQASADALLLKLLVSDAKTLDWLQVHRPDMAWEAPFENPVEMEHDLGTSLYYASCIGFREAVRLLLDRGVDVNTEGGFYGSPLKAAAKFGHVKTTELLLQRGAIIETDDSRSEGSALWWAADSGHEPIVRLLLEHEARAEAGTDCGGGTALYAAASNRHEHVVRLLLEAGAKVDTQTNYRKTALRAATMNGHESLMQLLLSNSADIELADENGQTPLVRGAISMKEGAVRVLLSHGAKLEAQDKDLQTALSWAAFYGQTAIALLLLESGAQMETTDINGQTPLTRAATRGHENTVRFLLQQGADVEAEDSAYLTPLDWAQRHGHSGVVALLRQAETLRRQVPPGSSVG